MRLVLFGTGMAANKLMKYSLRKENQIIAVVDNDSQKWGEEVRNVCYRVS